MQNGIAIVSIAATATVAIAVPIINARAERTRLRGLAVETSQAANATESEVRAAGAALSEVDQALHDVSSQRVRVSLRVGHEAKIAVTYGRALDALLEGRDVLRNTFHGGPQSDDPKGWKEVVVPLYRARQNFEQARWVVSDLAAELISPFSDTSGGSRFWSHRRPH